MVSSLMLRPIACLSSLRTFGSGGGSGGYPRGRRTEHEPQRSAGTQHRGRDRARFVPWAPAARAFHGYTHWMISSAVSVTIALLRCFLVLACPEPAEDGEHNGTDLPSSVPVEPITFDGIYVVNGKDNSISVLDADTHEVARTITLVDVAYPHHIYISPDGDRMVLAVPGEDLTGGHGGAHGGHGGAHGGALLVLDTVTGTTLVSRRLPQMNHNGIFSPDGASIWTAQAGEPGSVLVLDAATLATKAEIGVGVMPREVSLSADGQYFFVANGMSDDVSVIDAADQVVVATIPVGDGPVGAWPGHDNRMYVDNEAAQSVTVIDVETLAPVHTIDLGFMPGMATLAPAGDELWVTDADRGGVSFWSLAGEKTGDLPTGANAHAIVFSDDGKRAFVTNQGANTVSVIDVTSKEVLDTSEVGRAPNGLLFRSALRGA